MKIALGRRGDYAVRAMLSLARSHGNGLRKSRQIAAEMDIPEKYLPQVMGALLKDRLVESVAGPAGGYRLAREPGEISLLEVVEAAEGPVNAEECLLRGGPCDWEQACALHQAWASVQESMVGELSRIRFSALARIDRLIERGEYPQAAPAHSGRSPHRRGQRPAREDAVSR